jgi:hypothetical protein
MWILQLFCFKGSGAVSEPDFDLYKPTKTPHTSTERPITFVEYIQKPEEKRPDILHNKDLKIVQNDMKVSMKKLDLSGEYFK